MPPAQRSRKRHGEVADARLAGDVGIFAGLSTGGTHPMAGLDLIALRNGKLLQEMAHPASTLTSTEQHADVTVALAESYIIMCTQSTQREINLPAEHRLYAEFLSRSSSPRSLRPRR